MRVQNHIPIKAVAIREEDGLEIGTEYDVEDIMMGQSNTSVELVGTKGTYNSISFKFTLTVNIKSNLNRSASIGYHFIHSHLPPIKCVVR